MDQDRWKTINVIFHAALEVSSSERHSFVLTASEGDPALQAEVELLLKADRDAGSYLESPLVPAEMFSNSLSPVNPGDVLCGRFRILRAVGEGGMGHVFEALDSELAVQVALKIIRPEIAANPDALVRFRQEVRLARRITHPNVCRTFDIERETRVVDAIRGTKQEVVFLTMEFLEGETLASRIKRDGPLPLNEALLIARQTADALQAANALGIVHRDMKPANIMLVPVEATAPLGFRAVITDFGLARLDPVVSSGNLSAFSNTARPIGTLAYMAPEQLENTQISSATDIYAFGLILFEMVTGARAFPSDNLLSGIAQRLTGPPPLPQSLVPDLPTIWRRSIEGCLRLRPADRFQSTVNVMEVLDGKRMSLPHIGRHSLGQRLTLASWPYRRRIFGLAAICLIAMALFLGGLRLYRSVADSRVVPGALVYLAPVSNQTGEKSLDNVTELIRAGLSQSMQINLVDQGRVGDILQQMTKAPDILIDPPIAREIAMRAGAVRVVFATVTGSAGSYKLNIDVQQPDASDPARFRDNWPKSFPWHNSDRHMSSTTISRELLTAIRKSSDWIRLEVGESADDILRLDVPPEDVTTSNWQALADYSAAESFTRMNKPEEAITVLRDAIRLDPNFAMGYSRLGDNLTTLGKMQEGYKAYTEALDHEPDRRLTRRERDRIRGISALDTADYATAESAFRDYQEYFSHEYTGWFFRAYPLMQLGRTEEAIATLERAHAIEPDRPSAHEHLIRCYIILKDYEKAEHWIQELKRSRGPEDVPFFEGLLDIAQHNLKGAQAQFQTLLGSTPLLQTLGYTMLARIAAAQQKQGEAIQNLNSAENIAVKSGLIGNLGTELLDEASIECAIGQIDSCSRHIDKALSIAPGPNNTIYASAILGRAMTEFKGASAQRLLTQLEEVDRALPRSDFGVISEIAALRVHGEILIAQGRPKEALVEFRRVNAIDAPTGDREYLARSLEAVARGEPDPPKARQLQLDALVAYGRVARNPEVFWQQAPQVPPELVQNETAEFLRLAEKLGMRNMPIGELPSN